MTAAFTHPLIIQGGMGVGISNWVLAKAVSMRGQLGVVSGTCIDTVLVRRLQDGDAGGHMRRAMADFPLPEVVEDVLDRYFRPEGRAPGEPYRAIPMYRQVMTKVREQLTMLASFVEVWLAKEGHDGLVGVNLLTKVQMPNLATLYGAMLAKVDYVLMGAGIPKEIPGVLDRFAAHEPAQIKFEVEGLGRDETEYLTFDPRAHFAEAQDAPRPFFLPIIASNSLATMLARKATGRVDGFVIEAPTAGGHNAPPRGDLVLNERGEPVYGERDLVDLEKMKEHGLPFWLAGGSGSPEKLQEALEAGAAGIQVGTLFAYSDESGLAPSLKRDVIRQAQDDSIDVLTDGRASPTGFPFKVVQLEGTVSQLPVYQQRERVCDLGYLRTAFKRADGRIDYRCPAEPVDTYVKKGGDAADTVGRKCLCNALFATLGMAQARDGGVEEPPLITSGDELKNIRRFIGSDRSGYTAGEVIDYLLTGLRRLVSRDPVEAAEAPARA
ncbi:MAG TPA: nitronate monooxygenase [Longimicrobium sp.]|jgi:NAD(P)H-dependent flavin oxidoreductase YrpB (nitropropane dioxygenase family)